MAAIRLPRWILTQMCMPHGVRLSKLPVEIAEEEKPNRFAYSRGYVPALSWVPPYLPPEIPAVFEGWEYRFWAANLEFPKAPVIECRACHKIFGKEPERRNHPTEKECFRRLCAAYRLLLKDKKCLICNVRTTREKWGVPLCCSTCQQAWCEVEAQPQSLACALELVGSNP